MCRRFVLAMLGLGLVLSLVPRVSLAVDAHLSQAIENASQAIADGQHGHVNYLALHAGEALTHAEASEKVNANSHIKEAIKHLKEAVDEAKQGHADIATAHAESALNHLRQVM